MRAYICLHGCYIIYKKSRYQNDIGNWLSFKKRPYSFPSQDYSCFGILLSLLYYKRHKCQYICTLYLNIFLMVGIMRFERTTSCSRSKRSNQAELYPGLRNTIISIPIMSKSLPRLKYSRSIYSIIVVICFINL